MSKKIIKKSFLAILIALLILAVAYAGFFIWKIYSVGSKITLVPSQNQSLFQTIKSLSPSKKLELRGIEKDRINILLLGIAGKGKPGQNLTDTIMISSINPKTNQVSLLSIPRDLYVNVPQTDTYMKINSVYQLGLNKQAGERYAAELLRQVVSDITGLEINYYVILNFDGFIRVIDAIGGVNIMNERDLYDARYPGPNYSYETFELKKGFHKLDGATALKYSRERHDIEGDFGRAKRQQQILESAKSKIFSAGTMLNVLKVNEIFNALGDNVKTDIAPDDLESFWELAGKADTNNINNVVIDAWNKNSLLKVSHVFYGDSRTFVLIPRIGNWSEIEDTARNIFDLNALKRRKEEIARENAKVIIINKSGFFQLAEKIKKLLSDNFEYKNVIIISDPADYLENDSVVFDLTGGLKPFTQDELMKKLPAKSTEIPNHNYIKLTQNVSPDLIIVLGKDLLDKYKMEEDSFEEYNKASDTNEYSEFIKNNL